MKFEFLEKASTYIKSEDKLHIGIVGSRTITDREEIFELIDLFVNLTSDRYDIDLQDIIFVSGGAKGVDTFAEEYAQENNHDIVVIKPNWKKYRKAAGFQRNTEIVNISDIILAFVDKPTGGTWDTINKAEALKKPVFIQELYEEEDE